MSDFFDFTERYLSTDGKEYIDAACVRETLGIVDEYVDILGVIKKLKEERDGLKADLELTKRLFIENHDFVDKVCEAVDIQRPYIESEYDNAVKLIAGFKRERDELKEKCDKMKKRANAAYGASCGYSSDKAPAFLCNVISYRWEPGCFCYSGTTLNDDGHISVELDLTPNANYEWIFDPEDLRQYIQNYGREKKLGIIESVDYQNAKEARVELAYLYKQVLGKEKLDTDLSPHEIMKAILDEYRRVRIEKLPELVNNCIDELCDKYNVVQPDRSETTRERLDYIFGVLAEHRELANNNFNKAEGFRKEKRAVENVLAELRAKVREIYRSVVDDEWDECLAYTSALNDINEEYKRVVHNFEERTADWSEAQNELDRLEKFRRDVAKRIGRDPDVIKTPEVIMHALDIELERRENMDKLRDKLMDILGYEVKPGGVDKNNQAILEQVKKLKESAGHDKLFRDSVCDALDTTIAVSDSYLFKKIEKLKLDHKEIQEKYSRYCLAVGSLCNIPDEHREDISWIEDAFNHTKKDYLKWKTTVDELARFRSNICTTLCLGGETDDEDILKRVRMTRDCHDALCKDYTELRKAIWEAMDRKPETLPEETARLIGEVRMLQTHYQYIYKDRKDAYEVISKLNDQVAALSKAKEDLQQKFDFQSGLRQQWHARYESEHERANCVQKALDREREKCRVKDISLETAKKQYEKVCGNLETAECALNGMKSKVRSLQEEKTKVISALGQDIWDDAVK